MDKTYMNLDIKLIGIAILAIWCLLIIISIIKSGPQKCPKCGSRKGHYWDDRCKDWICDNCD